MGRRGRLCSVEKSGGRREAVHPEIIAVILDRCCNVKIVLPESRGAERPLAGRETLYDLAIADRLKMTHVVAINQIQNTSLAPSDQQVHHRDPSSGREEAARPPSQDQCRIA